MKDNLYFIGQEVWFVEADADGQKRLFNGYVTDWWFAAGRTECDYVLLGSQNASLQKSESQLYAKRDDAANAGL